MPASSSQQFLKDLDDKLWASANRLRANLDAAVYKHAVLGLVFLKYVSDSFAVRQAEIENQLRDPKSEYFLDQADYKKPGAYDAAIHAELEERDYYLEKNVFWVPPIARWQKLQDSAKLPPGTEIEIQNGKTTKYKLTSIGKLVDDALDAIEKENPKLKGVLNKAYTQLQLDPDNLRGLIDLVGSIPFQHADLHAKDILGHVYEYFLGQFALAEGKKGGQYFTPKSIVTLIVEMLEPYSGRVYDPACGSGGFFVSSERFIEEHGGKLGQLSVYGQESNPTTWRLAAMNMAIRGIDFNFGKAPANSFTSDQHPDLRADYVMANPPFNISEWWDAKLEGDPRWKYGTPPQGNANYAWLQHMLYHLAPNGMAGIVLADMALASNDSGEESIRKRLVEEDLVDCVVSLPDKLFASTPIGASIWILSKNKADSRFRNRKGKILFIDARKAFKPISRTLNDLPPNEVTRIANTYSKWRSKGAVFETISGFADTASTGKIAENRFALFPSAYIPFSREVEIRQNLEGSSLETLQKSAHSRDSECEFLLPKLQEILAGGTIETEEFLLSEVLEKSIERLGELKEPEILTCTENAGLILQRERFSKRVATENTQKYKVVRRGDIVYNPYLLWAGALDQCLIVDIGITSPAYEVFRIREGFDPTLVGIALKSPVMKSRYDGISIGTVKRRRRAPAERFLELKITLPCKKMQALTVTTTDSIQKAIMAHSVLCRSYREYLQNFSRKLLKVD